MKVTEGTWLDSNGNPFGIGHGSGYVQKHGRYQNWLRPTEPLADGLTYYDYVHLSHTRQGKWITYYHPESKGPLVCQKPLESKFLIYATTIFFPITFFSLDTSNMICSNENPTGRVGCPWSYAGITRHECQV